MARPAHMLGRILGGRPPKQFVTFSDQWRHNCIAANYLSFDHLVGAGEQREGDSDSKDLGGLEIYGQIDFIRLLDR
jgi:hypothetical protein